MILAAMSALETALSNAKTAADVAVAMRKAVAALEDFTDNLDDMASDIIRDTEDVDSARESANEVLEEFSA